MTSMEECKKLTLVITSGGFDPIHDGHIEYLKKAKDLGDFHVCILNSDSFLVSKKGYSFYTAKQRRAILSELKCVDLVIDSIDDDMTVCRTIEKIHCTFCKKYDKIIFAKGGDRFEHEIPESKICKDLEIQIIDGLGDKIESSSNLVNKERNKNV